MVYFCLMSSPSLGGNTDTGVGVCCALSLQISSLLQAHSNLGTNGLAQPGTGVLFPCSPLPGSSFITSSINHGASGPADWALPPGFQNHTPVRAGAVPTVGPLQSRAPGNPHLVEPGVDGG